jgi:hypothetical protein
MKNLRVQIVKTRETATLTPGATRGRLRYHVRLRARNGETVVVTENYAKRRHAVEVALFFDALLQKGKLSLGVSFHDETGD